MKKFITDSLINKTTCTTGKVKVTITDSKISGFCVEVRSSGIKTFILRYQDQNKKQQQYKIGDATIISTSDARQIAANLLTRVAAGENPQAERMQARECPTFKDFVNERYMPYIKSYKRSWDTDWSLLTNHLLPAFGAQRLNQITRTQLEKYKQDKVQTLSAGTVNRHIVLFRYIINLAIEWETIGVTKNPAAKIKMLATNNERNCILRDEDMRKLVFYSQQSENKSLLGIVSLLSYTGARKREILDAKWEYIDWSNNTLLVPLSKSGKPRLITLNDISLSILKSLPSLNDGSEYLFPNPKTGKPFTTIYYAWNTARTKAGLEHVRMHDLRHNFASWMVMNHESLYTVQNILGHSDPKTTQRYAHLSQEHLLAATNKLQNSLSGAAKDILEGLRQVA